MLSIAEPMRGTGKGNYYLNLAREDYYLEGGEPAGRWFGEGAKLLGFEGQLDQEAFRNLLAGLTPQGDGRLVQNAGRDNRQSGWDLTFSAPKSVSVFWSQASETTRYQVQQAQQMAVEAALSYLQDTAGLTRRGAGGAKLERAPLIFACFEHSTSRELDPQLHTHAILLNLAMRRDGTTGTIVTNEIFRNKMAAGALFRAELASQLRDRLGLEFESGRDSFELRGVPRDLCQAFSKRSAQIRGQLQAWGKDSAEAAKAANFETRKKKVHISRPKLFEAWRTVGREHGWSRNEAEMLLNACGKRNELEQTQALNRVLDTLPPKVAKSTEKTFNALGRWAEREGVPTRIIRETVSKNRSFLGFEIRHKKLFPKAPWWSPVSKIYVPYISHKLVPRRRVWGKVHREFELPFHTIQWREKFIFPSAPKWSPFHGISRKAIRVIERPIPWEKVAKQTTREIGQQLDKAAATLAALQRRKDKQVERAEEYERR